jgi:hypothetical protein
VSSGVLRCVVWYKFTNVSEVLIALMMEAASTSEMSVNFYQATWHINPEDSHVRTHRHENLKSHQEETCITFW